VIRAAAFVRTQREWSSYLVPIVIELSCWLRVLNSDTSYSNSFAGLAAVLAIAGMLL
jgi:hypothetical protein